MSGEHTEMVVPPGDLNTLELMVCVNAFARLLVLIEQFVAETEYPQGIDGPRRYKNFTDFPVTLCQYANLTRLEVLGINRSMRFSFFSCAGMRCMAVGFLMRLEACAN